MLSVIVAMDILSGTQPQFLMSGLTLIVMLLSFEVLRRFGKRPGDNDDAGAARPESTELQGQHNEPHTDPVKIAGWLLPGAVPPAGALQPWSQM